MSADRKNNRPLHWLKSMWCLLCLFFVLTSAVLPAYSAPTLLPNLLISHNALADSTQMPTQSTGGIHGAHHHVAHGESTSCTDLACDNPSDCGESCALSSCCSAPGVSNSSSSRLLRDHLGDKIYGLPAESAVSSTRLDPLFRPPIL